MSAPTGTVTFLFTDIEGSTRLWESAPEAMRKALERHDEIVLGAIAAHGGVVFSPGGDGFGAAFARAGDAVDAALGAQLLLDSEPWPETAAIKVRMALHTGEVVERDGNYFGTPVNRAARLMALAHGGQTICSDATAALLDPSVERRDLGEQRLRDLASPARVFQIGDGEFPPLRSLDAYPSNLPFQVTSFIGRETEVDDLVDLMRRSRMVTLTGVGGVGKTRLAVRVGAELLPDVHDGVWLCELATADTDDEVLEVAAHALSVTPRTGMALDDSIAEALRDRDLVVILDNCEHVLGASAELAERLLRQCPKVRILATSREGLGVDGEQLRPVRSLPLPETSDALGALGADAVALFVERSQALVPSFALDDTNAASVVEICRRLDGIPLAIELAAARVGSLQPREIAALLDERFRLLTGSRRRTVERHQTLRAAVDWSYSMLSELDRAVFDRLGVFTGSFDAAAAQAVCTNGEVQRFDVLDALDELVAKSMLNAEPSSDGTTRYQLLETMRQYALERLESADQADDVRRRHALHYAALTAEIGPQLQSPNELAARARLARDIDNLRAAVDWAIDAGETDLVVQLLVPIASEAGWNRGGGVAAWAYRALSIMPPDRGPEWAWLQVAAGFYDWQVLGEPAAALAKITPVFERDDVATDARAWACTLRCYTVMQLGDFDGATDGLYADYRELSASNGSNMLGLVASLAIFLGLRRDPDAIAVSDDALARCRAFGSPSALALAHYARGDVLAETDPAQARAELEEAVRLSDLGVADVVSDRAPQMLGVLAWRDGDFVAASRAIIQAFERALAAGDYSSCTSNFQIAQAVFGSCARWAAVARVEHALAAGRFPPLFVSPGLGDLDLAIEAAVASATAALAPGNVALIRAEVERSSRDEIARQTMADLQAIIEPA